MDTSDDPVAKEGQRAVRRVSKEFGRTVGRLETEIGRSVSKVVSPVSDVLSGTLLGEGSVADPFSLLPQGPSPTAPSPLGAPATGFTTTAQDTATPGAKRKKRLAGAAVLTQDWLPPTLGIPGLLGVS